MAAPPYIPQLVVPVWTVTIMYLGCPTELKAVRCGCSCTYCLCATAATQLCCSRIPCTTCCSLGSLSFYLILWQASHCSPPASRRTYLKASRPLP